MTKSFQIWSFYLFAHFLTQLAPYCFACCPPSIPIGTVVHSFFLDFAQKYRSRNKGRQALPAAALVPLVAAIAPRPVGVVMEPEPEGGGGQRLHLPNYVDFEERNSLLASMQPFVGTPPATPLLPASPSSACRALLPPHPCSILRRAPPSLSTASVLPLTPPALHSIIPVDDVTAVCNKLEQRFGFQHSSVQNQRENVILLLSNIFSHRCGTPATRAVLQHDGPDHLGLRNGPNHLGLRHRLSSSEDDRRSDSDRKSKASTAELRESRQCAAPPSAFGGAFRSGRRAYASKIAELVCQQCHGRRR